MLVWCWAEVESLVLHRTNRYVAVRHHLESISIEGGDVRINGMYHYIPFHQVRCRMQGGG